MTSAPDRCLSVVMPCFNEERTLRDAAERVLRSPYTAQLVIVDDGSSDRTLEIAKAIDDPRVHVLAQVPNQGKGAALRAGFAECTSRFLGGRAHRVLYFWHSLGNKLLTTLSNMFTNLNLTDMETCYKAFRREVIQSIVIEEDRFGFEPEITAKVAAAGHRIYEVGISYDGRTYADGKKIGWRDGMQALRCIVRYSPLLGRLTSR